MSKVLAERVEHVTGLSLAINGVSIMQINAAGVEQVGGTNYNWFAELLGNNFAVAGGGALAQSVLSVGSFRKYNVWELPNGGTDPFLDVNFWLPPDYDGSPLKVTLNFVKTTTATGTNIITTCRLACIGVGDSLDATASAEVKVTTAVGSNNCLFTVEHTVTPDNRFDGLLCHGLVQRKPTDVLDDYTGSVYLIGARVEYA